MKLLEVTPTMYHPSEPCKGPPFHPMICCMGEGWHRAKKKHITSYCPHYGKCAHHKKGRI